MLVEHRPLLDTCKNILVFPVLWLGAAKKLKEKTKPDQEQRVKDLPSRILFLSEISRK